MLLWTLSLKSCFLTPSLGRVSCACAPDALRSFDLVGVREDRHDPIHLPALHFTPGGASDLLGLGVQWRHWEELELNKRAEF